MLAFAVVLLSWDASRRYMHVRQAAQQPATEFVSSSVERPVITAPSATIGAKSASDDIPASSTARSDAIAPPPVSAKPAEPERTRRLGDLPTLPGVQQYTPGSRGHVAAIVAAIDSEQSRDNVAPVARLYFAFFDRTSDYEGLNYYIEERDGGASLESIADEFAGSTEFRARYGALDNAAFFDRIYRNVFDAAPDAAQRSYWVGQLDAGMSRGQVMVAFSESNAFRTATSNEVFVTMAYAEALHREPDAAGFARWVRFLDAGNPREAVIAGLIGSTRTKR